jgi:DNA-binding MarR family transcriptional regulator
VTLNIGATHTIAEAEPGHQKTKPRARVALETQVVDELSSWNPREFISAFRRWHQGSISLAHLNVLTLLEAEGSMSMSHLAEALDISVASATGIVDRMEARDLVARRHDTADRRVVLVEPAPGATALFEGIDARRRQGLETLLAMLTDDELTGLLLGHRALRAARTELKRAREAASREAAAACPPAQPTNTGEAKG